MNGARHQLFAGATFAGDKHRMRAAGRFANEAIQLLHLRRTADDVAKALFGFDLLPQHAILGCQFYVTRYPLQQEPKFIEIKGLGHVVIGAITHGLHRRLHGGVAGDHNHLGAGPAPPDLFEHFNSAGARKAQIEQHHVDAITLQQPIGTFGMLGHMSLKAESFACLAAAFTHCALVIHDQQIE